MKSTYLFLYKNMLQLILGICLVSALASCRKESPQINDPKRYIEGSFSEAFEAYWNGMNNNYIFWDTDPTNWDEIYRKYQPIFAKMNINDSTDVRKSYTYFKEMTSTLIDSHYALRINSPYVQDSAAYISPSDARHQKSPDYHGSINPNFFYSTIPPKYLDKGYVKGFINLSATDQFFAVAGKIKGNILYLHFNEFSLNVIKDLQTPNNAQKALQYYFDEVKKPEGLKGIIIDVRSNGGGYLSDLDLLVGGLTDKEFPIGATRSKIGNGRLDYSPWIPATVHPGKDAKLFTAPIIVLADLNSVSMAEMTTMALKAMPGGNVKFVGERTWGGNGPLLNNNDYYNSGQFKTGFLSLVYTSSTALRYVDGKLYEGIGFPPDIEVKYNKAALDAGTDPQLEKAISLIPQ
ncbi:S41 family peptidase [Pedobacter sp. UYP1]|uniref:S41 family peptidase n=1 Tax=Pedobacter sp. UYP1 TaxID=1756396 RepID=UPI003395D0C7